jgi:hypothetical protein
VKYACLCYEEEAKIEAMTATEWEDIVREVYSYNDELRSKGKLIAAQALQPVASATTVRVRGGHVSTSDGPFAETKEQLGGFFLIEASDLNEAIQIASRLPGARIGCIEVRPAAELKASGGEC